LKVEKDDELGMEFEADSDIYLTTTEDNKKTDFLANITHGVIVAERTTPIQAWKKGTQGTGATANTYQNMMTFDEEISLAVRQLTLKKSKSNITIQEEHSF